MKASAWYWLDSFRLSLSSDVTKGGWTTSVIPPAPQQPPPPPPPPAVGYIWGHVVGQSGVCLYGAVVEIVAGPASGRQATQDVARDAWSYVPGFEFSDLPYGETVRLRATLKGYRTQERELPIPNGSPPIQFAIERE
jgi:hypothetical protein